MLKFDGHLLYIYRPASSFRLYIYSSNAFGAEIYMHIQNATLNSVLYFMALEVYLIVLSYSLASTIELAILRTP